MYLILVDTFYQSYNLKTESSSFRLNMILLKFLFVLKFLNFYKIEVEIP